MARAKKESFDGFFEAATLISKEKGIPEEFIFDQFKESIVKAAKRQDAEVRKQAAARRAAALRKAAAERAAAAAAAGEELPEETEEERLEAEEELKAPIETENVFCDINPEKRTIKVYRRMTIVSEVYNPAAEMTAEQAANYTDRLVGIGDTVDIELDFKKFGRLFAMNVKGIIRQAISEEERRRYKKDVLEKDKEVVRATVVDMNLETGDARIQIAGNNGVFTLFKSEQLPNDNFSAGDEIKVYVSVVTPEGGTEANYANISRREPGLVRRLFESEVTEIKDGTVEIVSISREPGSRTKMAVSSKDENVDPVGACIGPKGQRVNAVIESLSGEKIDIIRFSENAEEYIAAALAPAKVTSVEVEPESAGAKRVCHVVVPDDQLSLAIGNKGQNVRLAAKLTGWKIDIKSDVQP